MAAAFNLTAQLNLQGPSNVGAIVTSIQKQLNNVSANVNVKINPATSQNIATLNAAFANFNTTLAITATNSTNAANAIRGLTTAIGQANNPLNNLQQNMTNNANAAAQLTQNLQNLNRTQNVCANDMEELGRQAAGTIRRFAAFGVVTGGIYKLGNAINSAAKEFLDFNKELVRVAQVTDTSLNNLASLTAQISQLSTTFGVASSDLIKVSSTLAQAGLSAKDTEKALKALALSALAPSFDSLNDTVEGSIALMRQFDISAGDLEGALGSVNAVAAKFAVEASDIITAIQRTGGVFATASRGVATGTEALNQFIAVFTSIRATTRESAETIATGLRTIFTRVQRGGTIEALKNYGVVLTDLEGKFVGPYEAVKRLSEGLSRLDPRDLRFGEIVEELGGFRQIGKVIPLIQQFAVTQQALKVAQQGQASLAYDAATAQESVANKMTKVREEFVALIRSIGESTSFQTFVKLSLDLTSQLIRLADAAKNVLPAVLAIAAIRSGPAALSFGRGFIGGLRRNQGGPIGFAGGGFVPGQGDGDTVPAMLTPGEFVIRKKAVKAIGVGRLAGINKYAGGGIVDDLDKGVGAAILEYKPGSESNTFKVKVGQQEKQVTETRQGLNEKTYSSFNNALNEGIRRGVNYATRIVSKDLGIPAKRVDKGEEQTRFLAGINDAAKGNLFEDILRTMRKDSEAFSLMDDPQKPFDFPNGLSGTLKDNYNKLPAKWIDAKSSFDAARGKGNIGLKFKTQRQIDIDTGIDKTRARGTGRPQASEISIEELKKQLKEKGKWGSGSISGDNITMAQLRAKDLVAAGLLTKIGTGKYNLVERNLGGPIQKFAKGGSAEDTVPALLTPGEFVINKKAASRIGLSTLHKMNHSDKIPGFNKGGSVQGFASGGLAGLPMPSAADIFINKLMKLLEKGQSLGQAKISQPGGLGFNSGALQTLYGSGSDKTSKRVNISINKNTASFQELADKLDVLGLDVYRARPAVIAWSRAMEQGSSSVEAMDRAIDATRKSINKNQVSTINTGGGYSATQSAGAGAMAASLYKPKKFGSPGTISGYLSSGYDKISGGIQSRASSVVNRLGSGNVGLIATMAGGAGIERLSQGYGGEKTSAGRNISAIGSSVLNYGSIGASLGGPLGALAGAAVGVVAGFAQAETAAKEFAVTEAKAAAELSAERSGKEVETYATAEKPTTEMRKRASDALKSTYADEERMGLAIESKNRLGFGAKTANFLTGGALGYQSLTNFQEDINATAAEKSKSQTAGSEQTQKLLLTDMKMAGKTFDDLAKGMNSDELFQYTNQIAQADRAYVYNQIRRAKTIEELIKAGKGDEAEKVKQAGIEEDKNLALASAKLAMADEDAAAKADMVAKAQKNLAVALQKSIMSLERTFDIMEQTGNRFSFELDNVAENAKSIMGGKGAKQSGLSSTMNILKNPEAYSADERKAAMQRGVSGLDPKTGRNLVRLASFAPNARNAALQISSQAGTDPESQREATEEIRRTLSAQIRTAFGGTDLSANMIKTLNDAITDATKDGAEINWDELLNKALGPSIKGGESANKIIEQQLKIQADIYAQITDISELYVSNMEKVVDRTNTLAEMQNKTDMSLRSAMGEKITSKDKISARNRSAAAKAGIDEKIYGNVGLMSTNIASMQAQRDAKIREKDALENAGASPQQLAKVNIELANLQNSLKKAEKGLEELPNELQSNIDDMIGEIQDRVAKMEAKKEAGSKFAEKLVGNTPEEMMSLNRTFGLLQNTLMGNITTINKSFVAQQAYAESLRGGKNAVEAMRDAQRAFADENKNALGLFSELMGVAGVEGPQFDMMKADLMENFAKAQGMGLEKNPMFQMILDQLRRDPAERAKEDPVVMALVEKIKKAQDMQTDAINTINNNAIANQQTAFTQAINEFTTKIEKAKLNLMINVQGAAFVGGQNPVAVNVVPGHANGGLIYASKGQHINFQPKGTDTVPAMLTPGEFVVNRKATQDNLPLLKSINSGYYARGGYLNPTQLVSSATSGLIENARANSMREQDPKDRKKTFFEDVSEIKSFTSGEKIVYEFARQFGFLTGEPISGINKFNALIGGPFDPGPVNNLKSVPIDPVKKIDSIVAKIKDSPTQYLQAKSLSTNANKRWGYLEEIINNLNTGESIIKKDSIYKKIKPNKDELDTQTNMENTLSFMSAVKSNATNEQKLIRKVYDEVGKKTQFWFPVQDFRGFSPSNFPKADYFSSGGRARGTDTIPAMLTRGEFVVNKDATQKNLGLLKQINKGYSRGGAVQYYQNGGVAGGSSSNGVIDVLGGRLDNFIQQLSQAIPSTVRLEVPQPIPVNVVINGAGILQNVLGGPLGELIATQIREAFARQSRATEGAVGE